jgi:hypothetical protein
MNTYVIGFLWDDYTPQVESQLLKDLMGLQAAIEKWPDCKMQVAAGLEATRLLAVLGIPTATDEQAFTWRTYHTEPHSQVYAPDWAKTVIACDLFVRNNPDNRIVRGPHFGHGLRKFGRSNGYDPFRRRPPQTKWATTDPMITLVWGG